MRQMVALIVSVVLGAIAVFAVKLYINRETQSPGKSSEYDLIELIVAKRPLHENTPLNTNDLALREMPRTFVTSDMIQADRLEYIKGKVLSRSIERGGLLMESDFRRVQEQMSIGIPRGMRLVTMAVDSISGVAGLIQPRQKVDIFLTRFDTESGMSARSSRTLILLSNVTVYAVDDRISTVTSSSSRRRERDYTSVTLSVSAKESALLIAARESGKLSLSLRSPKDSRVLTNLQEINSNDIEKFARKANLLRKEMLKK